MTPELGFEGWVEFHQIEVGSTSGSGSNLAKSSRQMLQSWSSEKQGMRRWGWGWRGSYLWETLNNESGLDSVCSKVQTTGVHTASRQPSYLSARW